MSEWWYYEAKPTIQTDEGIKARSQRGAFVKHWWADRWLAAMEKLMDQGRLQRGRRYARQGQVLSLVEGKGQISAQVQGSHPRPYKVQIEVAPLSEAEWAQVLQAMGERPLFVASLLAGEMPQTIEEVFSQAGLSLFPHRAGELMQACSCPDWAEVCKHLAAVHYILAERFDEDPFLLFRLRGMEQARLLAALGPAAPLEEAVAPPTYEMAPPLDEVIGDFWQMGPSAAPLRPQIAPPDVPYPLLARLGEPEFLPEARRWLAPLYDMVSQRALAVAFATEEEHRV